MATANYAIHLNGTTQYFTIADNASFDYATGNAFTFGLVFRLDSDYETQTKPQYLWSRQNQHAMYIDHGELVYYFNGAGGPQTWRTGEYVVPERTYHLTLTGAESTNTTVVLYLDGEAKATTALTGGMPNDTNTALYVGVDYGHVTAGQFMKGNICGFYQSNTTAISAANALIAYNSGVYDIDTVHAIVGLVDGIGFVENTGTTYDNALNAGVDGAGQGTPTWLRTVNPLQKTDYNGNSFGRILEMTGVGQRISIPLCIRKIKFLDATAADQAVELKDVAGNLVYRDESNADDYINETDFYNGLIVNGLETTTCGGGRVLVYIS